MEARLTPDYEYRVRLYALHGPMHDVYVIAPDAFQAHMQVRQQYPGRLVQSIKRVSELES